MKIDAFLLTLHSSFAWTIAFTIWLIRWKVSRSPGGGDSQKNLVGVCDPLPKTLTLFMTKICDIPYPIYDLKGFCWFSFRYWWKSGFFLRTYPYQRHSAKTIPYLWPKRLKNHTLWGHTYLYSPYKRVSPPGFSQFGVDGLCRLWKAKSPPQKNILLSNVTFYNLSFDI